MRMAHVLLVAAGAHAQPAKWADPAKVLRTAIVIAETGFDKNDEYDELFRRARRTGSEAERGKLYARMLEIVAAYAPMGGGIYRIENTIAKPWVAGYRKDSFRSQSWRFMDIALARRKSGS